MVNGATGGVASARLTTPGRNRACREPQRPLPATLSWGVPPHRNIAQRASP